MTCLLVFLPFWCINTIIHRRYNIIFNGKWQINFIFREEVRWGFCESTAVAGFCSVWWWCSLAGNIYPPFKSQISLKKGDVRIPLTMKSFSCSFLQKSTTWSRQLFCGISFISQQRIVDFFSFYFKPTINENPWSFWEFVQLRYLS